jgi:hypothetical protein
LTFNVRAREQISNEITINRQLQKNDATIPFALVYYVFLLGNRR